MAARQDPTKMRSYHAPETVAFETCQPPVNTARIDDE